MANKASRAFVAGVWWAAALHFAVLAPVAADESVFNLPLESLSDITVVTTSLYNRKMFDAPGIVTVIPRDQIVNYGANNLAEVVERLPGTALLTGYVFPNNAVSIRGDLPNQNDTHLLILINGRPFLSGFSGSFNGVVLSSLPVDAVERLEFIRGPGSVLYGSNAYSGVLNIITRKAIGNLGLIEFTAGSFGSRGASGFSEFKQGDFEVATTLEAWNEDGWQGSMVDELGVRDEADFGDKNRSLLASARWRNFDADVVLLENQQTHFGSTPRWPSQNIDRAAYFFGLGHRHRINNAWQLRTNLDFSSSRQDYAVPTPSNPSAVFDGDSHEARLETYATGQLGSGRTLLIGATGKWLSGDVGGGPIVVPEYDWFWWSVFGQYDHRWSDALSLIAGGQWNKTGGVDGEFVPRLGAIYKLTPNSGIKLLYSEAFRSPFPAEKDTQALPILAGNPGLDPELVQNTDLQWFYSTGDYQFSATYFHADQKDLIQRVDGGAGMPGTFANLNSEREIQGLEFEWQFRPSARWDWTGSAQFQRNESDGEDDVTLAPDFLFKLGAVFKPGPGIVLGMFDVYTDDYQDTRIIKPGSAPVNPSAGGKHLLSFNARFDLGRLFPDSIWKRSQLSLYATNLLDEEFHVPEYSRNFINTVPGQSERGYFVTLGVGF